jgi:hypothetical protein
VSIPLARIEGIIDGSGVAPVIEALLPAGVRHRQLTARTLLTGMMLTLADDRPAHLTRVHQALTTLPGPDQARLGVTESWGTGPHQLTYRQAGRTFSLAADALGKDEPDGASTDTLAGVCDDLLEASIPPGTRTPPPRWRWTGPTWRPGPARRGTAPPAALTRRRTGGTATPTCPAPRARCSLASISRPAP